MSIRPVEFNGMIQQTHDVSTMKQNEDNRPMVQQQNIQFQEQQQEQRVQSQIQRADQKKDEEYRYDRKERGKGGYGGSKQKGKQKKEDEPVEDGKVIFKGHSSSFDMKI